MIKYSFGFCGSIGCSVLISWPSALRLCLNPTFQRAADFRQIVDADRDQLMRQKPARNHRRQTRRPVCAEREASGRRREFPGQPPGRARFERVRCNDADLNVIAFRAFEQPPFETGGSRRNALQHHPRLAAGTARTFNHRQEELGRVHDASPWSGESQETPGHHRWLPKRSGDGTSMLFRVPEPVVNIAHSQKVFRTASRDSRTTRTGRYVRYRSQAVENIDRCSIQTTMTEPARAGLVGLCSRLPKLPRAVNMTAPAHRRPLGPFCLARIFGTDSKKSLHGTGWRFPCRESQEAGRGPHGDTNAI